MANTVLGIDIGYDSLKLALVSGGTVRRVASAPMPVKLLKEGRIVSPETMGELIRNTMRDNLIRCRDSAVALSAETVFTRTVTLPQMTVDQLNTNLPYEFRDYITDELKNYVFDYAMINNSAVSQENEGSAPVTSMELLAVAAPVSLFTELRETLRKAGVRLSIAAPNICAYINIIRRLGGSPDNEYCFLDLGYRAIRMHIFRGDRHIATRILEVGLDGLDDVIAEEFNVDVHLAHTYLLTNYQDCQENEKCVTAYNNVAVELMRAVNFYRFSNPDSNLSEVWLCGGGTSIPALCKAVSETLEMNIHPASELIPGGAEIENCNALVQAIGIALGGQK